MTSSTSHATQEHEIPHLFIHFTGMCAAPTMKHLRATACLFRTSGCFFPLARPSLRKTILLNLFDARGSVFPGDCCIGLRSTAQRIEYRRGRQLQDQGKSSSTDD